MAEDENLLTDLFDESQCRSEINEHLPINRFKFTDEVTETCLLSCTNLSPCVPRKQYTVLVNLRNRSRLCASQGADSVGR